MQHFGLHLRRYLQRTVYQPGRYASNRCCAHEPRTDIKTSEVHTSSGTSFACPAPSFLATSWVRALPSPMSKKLAYPIKAQAKASTPNRSLPKPRIRIGIERLPRSSERHCRSSSRSCFERAAVHWLAAGSHLEWSQPLSAPPTSRGNLCLESWAGNAQVYSELNPLSLLWPQPQFACQCTADTAPPRQSQVNLLLNSLFTYTYTQISGCELSSRSSFWLLRDTNLRHKRFVQV